jgi:SAM-dependent methyltransferase
MKPSFPRLLTFRRLPAMAVFATALAVMSAPALAEDFNPQVGLAGKDVIWMPTAQAMVDRMLDIARVTPEDLVIDLGSGDGRTVISAAKRGARALGIEYNPDMVELARQNAGKEGVSTRARFVHGDIFETDFSQASVLTLFLLPKLNLRLRPAILQMQPGTRIVSNSFDMDDWEPDETAKVAKGCNLHCLIYFWMVPAQVAGIWKFDDGELVLTQRFQIFAGTFRNGRDIAVPINGRLRGRQISFTAGDTQYTGIVTGDAIEGVARTGDRETGWRAVRS